MKSTKASTFHIGSYQQQPCIGEEDQAQREYVGEGPDVGSFGMDWWMNEW